MIERETVDEYVRCMRNPQVLRTMGAEYRADLLDLEHDCADRMTGRRITCPLLTLWAEGGLSEQFGDPLAIWRMWADDVDGRALAGGLFLMEGSPQEVKALIRPFLSVAHRSSASLRCAPRRPRTT